LDGLDFQAFGQAIELLPFFIRENHGASRLAHRDEVHALTGGDVSNVLRE